MKTNADHFGDFGHDHDFHVNPFIPARFDHDISMVLELFVRRLNLDGASGCQPVRNEFPGGRVVESRQRRSVYNGKWMPAIPFYGNARRVYAPGGVSAK